MEICRKYKPRIRDPAKVAWTSSCHLNKIQLWFISGSSPWRLGHQSKTLRNLEGLLGTTRTRSPESFKSKREAGGDPVPRSVTACVSGHAEYDTLAIDSHIIKWPIIPLTANITKEATNVQMSTSSRCYLNRVTYLHY